VSARSQLERVQRRLEEVRKSREGAEKDGKWTAASTFSQQEDRLTLRALELEADLAEEEADRELEADPEALIAAIKGFAMDLPAYLLDDLIAALEETRRCASPETWAPSGES